MAQGKSNKVEAKKPDTKANSKTAKATPPPVEDRSDRLDKYTVKPEFWDTILDALPPWGDEIAAIVLIIFGVMSFLSLLNASPDASVAAAWSSALPGLFGYGSAIVCAPALVTWQGQSRLGCANKAVRPRSARKPWTSA